MKKHEHYGSNRKSLENPFEVLLTADLRTGKTLLDIGTGTGYLALAAAEIVGPKAKVFALDIHKESIKTLEEVVARKAITNVEPIVADAVEKIPVPPHSVDISLLSNVLHGFVANEEFSPVMANVAGAMKEEGEIVIIDFKKAETLFGPPLALRLDPPEVEDIMKVYGYILSKQFEAGPYHYGLVFRKQR